MFNSRLPGRLGMISLILVSGGFNALAYEEVPFFQKPWKCDGRKVVFQVPKPQGPGDNLRNIQGAINDAKKALLSGEIGRAEVRLARGASYHLAKQLKHKDALRITADVNRGIGCFTFDGQNATIRIDASNSGFFMNGCRHCAIKNVEITPHTAASTQGVIKAVNRKEKVIFVKVHPDFPLFNYHIRDSRKVAVGKSSVSAVFYRKLLWAAPNHLTHLRGVGSSHSELRSVSVANRAERILRLELSHLHPQTLGELKAGDLAAIRIPAVDEEMARAIAKLEKESKAMLNKHPHLSPFYVVGPRVSGVYIDQSTDVLLYNVTLRDFGGMGLYLSQNFGNIMVNQWRFEGRKPNSLQNNGSDGFHFANNRGQIVIRNSHFSFLPDDAINIKTVPELAESANGRFAILKADWRGNIIMPGDRYRIHSARDGAVLGVNVVKEVKIIGPRRYRVEFRDALPRVFTLNNTPPKGRPSRFVNLDSSSENFLIEKNTFLNSLRNGIIVRSTGTIRANRFSNLGLFAVNVGPTNAGDRDTYGELGTVAILDNHVDDAAMGVIKASRPLFVREAQMKKLRVARNKIYRSTSPLIVGDSYQRLSAQENDFIYQNEALSQGEGGRSSKASKPNSGALKRIAEVMNFSFSNIRNMRKNYQIP